MITYTTKEIQSLSTPDFYEIFEFVAEAMTQTPPDSTTNELTNYRRFQAEDKRRTLARDTPPEALPSYALPVGGHDCF